MTFLLYISNNPLKFTHSPAAISIEFFPAQSLCVSLYSFLYTRYYKRENPISHYYFSRRSCSLRNRFSHESGQKRRDDDTIRKEMKPNETMKDLPYIREGATQFRMSWQSQTGGYSGVSSFLINLHEFSSTQCKSKSLCLHSKHCHTQNRIMCEYIERRAEGRSTRGVLVKEEDVSLNNPH